MGRQYGLAPVQELAIPPCRLCGRMAMSALPSARDIPELTVAADQAR
jgi:hypothetical protein